MFRAHKTIKEIEKNNLLSNGKIKILATGISEPIDMADRKIIQQLKRHDSMKKRMVYILVGFLFLAGCPQANADSASPKAVQRNGKEEFPLQEKGDKKEQRKAYAVEHIYSHDIHIGITRGEEVKYIGT